MILFGVSSRRYDLLSLHVQEGTQVVTGTVAAKTEKEQTVQYLLRNVSFRTPSGAAHARRAILYAEDDSIAIGSRIQSSGPVQGFSSGRNEGNFDFADYYKSQKILFQQFSETITVDHPPAFFAGELLYRFRKTLRAGICTAADAEDAGILCAMLLGDRGLIGTDTKFLYQRNGISHIMAISGLHISVFGMSLFRLLRNRLGIRYRISCLFSGGAVFLYVAMSGMSASAVRAMLMFFFYLGAKWSGRTYDVLTALGFSAVLALLFNPLSLMQAGFLLSYGAVLSIAIVLPAVKILTPAPALLLRLPGGESLWSQAQLSFSVWIGLAPLSAALFYYVSPYSVLLNLIVIPCCPLLLADGFISGMAGIRFPALSQMLELPDHWILQIFSMQMKGAGRLPGNNLITGHIPAWRLLLYELGLFLCCMVIRCGYRAARSRCLAKQDMKTQWRRFLKRHAAACLLPVLTLAVLLWNPSAGWFRVDFLDVGQGDGICISSGHGTHIMIDGGSTSEKQIGSYRIRPFLEYNRIQKIDLWIVTHTDEDHVNGLLELLENGYPVSTLVFSEISVAHETGASQSDSDSGTGEKTDGAARGDDMMKRLIRAAEHNHTAIQTASAGSVCRAPDLQMTCLYPEREETLTDKNELSQIWLLEHDGWRFLFTGDLGETGEALLGERGLLSDVDVLKAGHHGSNYSGSADFLRKIAPEYAVISVGEGNRYHHPGKDAVKRLSDCGAKISTTMECGQITFYEKRGRFYLKTFCGE